MSTTISGIGFLFWCALSKCNPDRTLSETTAIIGLDDIEVLSKKMMPPGILKKETKKKRQRHPIKKK